MMDNNDLCEIGRYSSVPEAEMVRGLLESAGIMAMLPDLHMSTIMSHAMIGTTGGVRVLIARVDLGRAQEILNADFESGGVDTAESSKEMRAADLVKRFFQTSLMSFIFPLIGHAFAFYQLGNLMTSNPSTLRRPHAVIGILCLIASTFIYISLCFAALK